MWHCHAELWACLGCQNYCDSISQQTCDSLDNLTQVTGMCWNNTTTQALSARCKHLLWEWHILLTYLPAVLIATYLFGHGIITTLEDFSLKFRMKVCFWERRLNFSGHFVKASKNPHAQQTVNCHSHHIIAPSLRVYTQSKFPCQKNESIALFPCHTCQCLWCLKVSHCASNSFHPFIFEDRAICSACR